MKNKLWRVGKEEIKYIEEAIDSGLSGIMNTRFEEAFAKKFGVNFAIGVNSGTSALHSALFAVGVNPGDEVIVPPITFAAPAFAVLQQGAVPVFADVDPETFNIDPEDIKKKITDKTKAIIPVALYGLPCDMDAIMAIAGENKLMVIEDNAECYLGRYKGKLVGTIGHMSIFSFERSKHMTTGNGGMIITNDEELAVRVRKFSVLGYSTLTANQASYKSSKDTIQQPDFLRHEFAGYNYRLPEICAAMGLAQLEKLEIFVEKRQKIAEIYSEAVKDCEWLVPQKTSECYVNTYWTYVLKLQGEKLGISWLDFRKTFLEEGGDRFYGAWAVIYIEPAFKNLGYKKGLCPIAEDLQKRLIQLKTNYETLAEAEKQATVLKKTIQQKENKMFS